MALKQPDIPKQHNDGGEKDEPHLPAHTRALGHDQHALHGSLELVTRIRKLIVHFLRQRSGIADLVADAEGELFNPTVSLCLLPFLLPFEKGEGQKGDKLTSFNIPTFLLISDTWSSFWLSSSLNTASLYAPLLSGVAVLKLAAEPPLSVAPPGYAANVFEGPADSEA